MNGIHDQHCRCRDCKPATARRPFGSVVPLHHDLPPHVRRNMDRIVWAALQQALASTVIAEVHKRRCEQITLHGHTPAIDAARPLGMMIRKVGVFIGCANDHCGHGAHASPENLANGRKHLVTAAALLIAVIDRIDADLAAAGGEG